ncbi:iron complex transport system substrate-binding protein [Kibdelosporangium banguiense]|uniref:Iron complex transport system substrate-binding protein n=1 Tax=Kibdelosporangium banguiense TaxID=1365924 RepID=A0ABS4TPM4_9PSEU|nr:iron-siderophore ABC transporter substrate-binding protein [Kibdelosporangium banguiense]MBP2326346.1 iron complex transport system substrate-binding protein [Kibdelosporangium banguiense]
MRKIATLVAAALVLSACGTGTTPPGGGAAPASGQTRTIKHAMGETQVPVTLQRVVVLDTDKLDTMFTLGLTPAGAAQASQNTKIPTYLGPGFAGVKAVGTTQEPDLDAIRALQPDLILGSKFRQEKFYNELTTIAPTVFTELVGVTWKENFLLDADALGKKAEAQAALDKYKQRAADLKRTSQKVSIVRFMPDEIRVYGPESFSGIVLGDAGVPRPERQQLADKKDKRFDKVSPERVQEVDGDVIFVSAYGEKAAQRQAEITAGPLWTKLSAVAAGRSYVVDDEVWMLGIGVTAAGKILDDLTKHLTA